MKLVHLLMIASLLFIGMLLVGCSYNPNMRTMILHEGDSATFEAGTARLVEYKPKKGSPQEAAELRQWWFDFDERFSERR